MIDDPGPLDLGELLGSTAVRKDSEPELFYPERLRARA